MAGRRGSNMTKEEKDLFGFDDIEDDLESEDFDDEYIEYDDLILNNEDEE
jgi:hypothetical protein